MKIRIVSFFGVLCLILFVAPVALCDSPVDPTGAALFFTTTALMLFYLKKKGGGSGNSPGGGDISPGGESPLWGLKNTKGVGLEKVLEYNTSNVNHAINNNGVVDIKLIKIANKSGEYQQLVQVDRVKHYEQVLPCSGGNPKYHVEGYRQISPKWGKWEIPPQNPKTSPLISEYSSPDITLHVDRIPEIDRLLKFIAESESSADRLKAIISLSPAERQILLQAPAKEVKERWDSLPPVSGSNLDTIPKGEKGVNTVEKTNNAKTPKQDLSPVHNDGVTPEGVAPTQGAGSDPIKEEIGSSPAKNSGVGTSIPKEGAQDLSPVHDNVIIPEAVTPTPGAGPDLNIEGVIQDVASLADTTAIEAIASVLEAITRL